MEMSRGYVIPAWHRMDVSTMLGMIEGNQGWQGRRNTHTDSEDIPARLEAQELLYITLELHLEFDLRKNHFHTTSSGELYPKSALRMFSTKCQRTAVESGATPPT